MLPEYYDGVNSLPILHGHSPLSTDVNHTILVAERIADAHDHCAPAACRISQKHTAHVLDRYNGVRGCKITCLRERRRTHMENLVIRKYVEKTLQDLIFI